MFGGFELQVLQHGPRVDGYELWSKLASFGDLDRGGWKGSRASAGGDGGTYGHFNVVVGRWL